MGIDGLLKFLRPVTQKQHISTFKNQTAGIDVMSWIYRGCYSCNFQLSQNVQSFKYLYYLLEMVQILSYYNIKPIFIFDGRSFQLKGDTNQKRIKQKQQNKAKAQQCMKDGKIEQARKYFSRCIFIDEKIISTTMNVMHTKNIPFYVAPYEADCQIAKLKNLGVIDVAISEDSDLIAYGVNTILKLNQNGDCDYIDPGKWAPRDVDSQFLKEYFAMGYVNKVEAAILAGSDYNPSIKGIGIKRAVKHMYRQAKMSSVINKLKQQKTYADKIPQNYQQLIQHAKMIFLFATVYNPLTKQLEYLNPDLLSQYKPADLSQEQLLKIVGPHYGEYLEREVHLGKTRAKDLTPREVVSVNIRELFGINKENMIAHQTVAKRRRLEIEKLRQQREKQIEQGVIRVQQMKPNHIAATKPSPTKSQQLTEQQKEKKKQDRKKRIIKLQDIMSSVVQMCEEEDEEDRRIARMPGERDEEGEEKGSSLEVLQRKLNQVKENLEKRVSGKSEEREEREENSDSQESQSQKGQQNEESQIKYDQQSSEQSFNLAFLNPFAKMTSQNQKTATKEAKK